MKKPIKLFAAVMSAALMLGACSPAYAVHKVKGHPVYLVNTTEFDNCEFKKNAVYIEYCYGIVDTKGGDGHVKGHRDWLMDYSECRYKKKRLKPGTKVTTYLPLDKGQWPVCRYDFITVNKKPVLVLAPEFD